MTLPAMIGQMSYGKLLCGPHHIPACTALKGWKRILWRRRPGETAEEYSSG